MVKSAGCFNGHPGLPTRMPVHSSLWQRTVGGSMEGVVHEGNNKDAGRHPLGGCALIVGVSGCAVEVRPSVGNCSPSYNPHSTYGNFSVQQAGHNRSIQWGMYPNVSATRYVLDVYAGPKKVDRKNQNYAPHGSVSRSDATRYSGYQLLIIGDTYDASKNTLHFELRCVIA